MRFGHWGMFFSVTTLSSNYEKRYFTRIEIIKFSFCSYEAILSHSKRNGEFYGDFVSHFFRFCSSKLSLKFHIFCASITLFIHMSVLQIYSILDLVALIGDIHHINEEFVFEICLLFFASIGTQLLILCKWCLLDESRSHGNWGAPLCLCRLILWNHLPWKFKPHWLFSVLYFQHTWFELPKHNGVFTFSPIVTKLTIFSHNFLLNIWLWSVNFTCLSIAIHWSQHDSGGTIGVGPGWVLEISWCGVPGQFQLEVEFVKTPKTWRKKIKRYITSTTLTESC